MSELNFYQSKSYITVENDRFSALSKSLCEYKQNKRHWPSYRLSSAETDINNLLDIQNERAKNGVNFWQVNSYIVSADQLLISWSNEIFAGVPLVVLPSVWLSLILKYSGRTDDDYESFCLFLTQRYHSMPDYAIDTGLLLSRINQKTNESAIKEKIIYEIVQKKSEFSFDSPEDYDSSIEKAFDTILKEIYGNTQDKIESVRKDMDSELFRIRAENERKYSLDLELEREEERKKTLEIISKAKAHKRVAPFKFLSKFGFLVYILAGLILILGIAGWSFEIQPLYSWLLQLPEKWISSLSQFCLIWRIISAAFGLVFKGVDMLISWLGSPEREQSLYKKMYKKVKRDITQRASELTGKM